MTQPKRTGALRAAHPQGGVDAMRPRRAGQSEDATASLRDDVASSPASLDEPAPIRHALPAYEPLGEEELALIEANAETILQEIGIEFRDDPEALAMWREAGADVSGERVRFSKGLCRHLLKTAPSTFTQHARNPARSVEIGGDGTVFAPVYGAPFVRDLDGARRNATLEDLRNFVRLAQIAPSMHHVGGTICEPVDVAVEDRHLDVLHALMTLSDKPFMGAVTTPERAEDTIAMCRILFGAEVVETHAVTMGLINANSPMTFDGTMLRALRIYAQARQATIVTPFVLMGAMSPVT